MSIKYCHKCGYPHAIDYPGCDGLREQSADKTQVGGTHYKDMELQPWELMQAILTPEEFRGFLKGNAIKYAMRQGRKGDASEDAQKARHYAAKLKEVQR